MLKINTIVCGTDFSPAADHALEVSTELADSFGAEVMLVHVIEPLPELKPTVDGDVAVPDGRVVQDALKRQARMQLDQLVDRFSDRDAAILPVATVGKPVERLVEAAEAEMADMIVVASGSDHAGPVTAVGDVAGRLLGRSQVPVLVVPAAGR